MPNNETHGERIMMTRRIAPALIGGLLALFLTASAFAAPAAAGLRDGVVVDAARGTAYVMHPQGGIQALDLRRGRVLWRSAAGERPLALVGDRLVAQAQPGSRGELRIVALDVRGGSLSAQSEMQLPQGIHAAVTETIWQDFRLTAMPSQEGILLSWEAEALSGLPKPRDRQFGSAAQATAASRQDRRHSEGTAVFDPATGRLALAPVRQITRPAVARSLGAPSVRENRFSSADGRHVLTSRLVDDGAALPFQWTVSDARTGAVLGAWRAEASMAPFVVAGNRLIHVAPPASQIEDGKLIDRPLRLRAVDLATGREAWRREIRDTAYRGPMPN